MAGEELDFVLKLVDGITGPADAMSKALEKVGMQLDRANTRQENAKKKQTGFIASLKRMRHSYFEVAGAISSTMNVVKGIGSAIGSVADFFAEATGKQQAFSKSLELLTDSKEKADALKDSLDKFRPAFFGTEDQLKSLTQKFLAAGISAKGLGMLLPGVSDIAALNGSVEAGDEFAQTLIAIKASGAITQKQLKRLHELGLNPTVKAGAKGADALNSITLALEKMNKGKGIGSIGLEAAGESITVLVSRLHELPENIFEDLGKSEGIKNLVKQFNKFLNLLGPGTENFEKMRKAVEDGFNKIFETVFGGTEVTKDSVDKFVTGVVGAVDFFVSAFQVVYYTIKGVIDLINFLGETIAGIAFVFYKMGEGIVTAFDKVGAFIGEFTAKAFLWGEQFVNGLVDGIKSALPKVGDAFRGMADKFTNLFEIHSPSGLFAYYGEMSALGFSEGFQDESGAAAGAAVGASVAGVSAKGMGGSQTANVTVSVNVDGSTSPADTAAAVAKQLREMLPDALVMAFDTLAYEQGAA